jgi:Tfp pilus assembly protein PilF
MSAPADPHELITRGNAWLAQGRASDALACYEEALRLQPEHAEALKNRGNAWRMLQRPDLALASYRLALQYRPDYPEALNNCGVVLQETSRPQEALPYYEHALRVRPDNVGTLINRAVAWHDLAQPAVALHSYRRALELDAHCSEAQFGAGLCHLLLGQFRAGWRGYEWRWQVPAFAALRRNFTQPLWLGNAPLHGKTIVLHAEQGLGDTLQFCRYVPLVAALGARVWLEVQAPLQALLAQFTQVPGVVAVVARGEPLPLCDYHCPLLSLPLALDTELHTIPAAPAYLQADAAKVEVWRARLAAQARPLRGLVWAGSPTHVNARHRAIALEQLAPLYASGPGRVVSVQKEVPPADREAYAGAGLLEVAGELHDFSDTAALLACLDHIVTVDTAVAHLAGALGRPATLLLPYRPDFRWLMARADTPWYPSLKLVRQDRPGDWRTAIAQVDAQWRTGG